MRTRNKVSRLWIVILISMASGMLAATCFGGREKVWNNSRLTAVFRGAPDAACRLQNPYRDQENAILAGRKLFLQHCAQCHGRNAEGSPYAPPLRSAIVRQVPDGALFWFLKNGKLRAGMPSWSGLPPQQRWQLVSFLKSLQYQ